MKRRIRVALYVRVVAVLIGPGLYYLLANTTINDDAPSDPSSDDFSTSRQLLSVKDQPTRDDDSLPTAAINDSITEDDQDKARSVTVTHGRFTRGFHKNSRIAMHVLASCYCFLMLAVICDEYFIGSIEVLCQKLNMQQDVVGATFMAMATSSPELFINCVSTFITEGDIGVETIVGSAVFNILAVPACCGLTTRAAFQLDRRSISRDCFFYGCAVIALIAVIYDNVIMWYEAAGLVAAYGVYLICMYGNDTMSEKTRIFARNISRRIRYQAYQEVDELTPLFNRETVTKDEITVSLNLTEPLLKLQDDDNCATNPWKVPADSNVPWFLLRWPITFTLWCTIPDSRRYKGFYILTFINCVVWIGCISYFIIFMSTNVDSFIGLTFLAAGTSLPEAVSSVIVTGQGYASMGISNSIGSNTFDILLCLGLPWLIKTLIVPTISGQPWITLKSTGITYSIISLLTTLAALYFSLVMNKFKLDRKVGVSCLIFYLLFIMFACLVEMNIFRLTHPAVVDL